jgi:transposase
MNWKKMALEQAALIEQLHLRIAELEREIAALKKNSANSSKPPSSDIVKPPKPKNKGKRKIGAQKGHLQHTRQPFAPEQVDTVVELKLNVCPDCGGKLTQANEKAKVHQQVELADKPFIVTEVRRPFYWCRKCQGFHIAKLPGAVAKSGLFGPKLIALVAYLKGRCHMSYKTIQGFLNDALGIHVSTGFLTKLVYKVSEAMAEPYAHLVKALPEQKHLHIDETGGKENGKKRWNWCMRGDRFTVFSIDSSRASAVLERLLGKDYSGIISCDFWGAYKKFARITGAGLQFCWAHLIREVKFLSEREDSNVAEYGKRLLLAIGQMFSTIHRQNDLKERTWQTRMAGHRKSIMRTAGYLIPENKDAKNIVQRLKKWEKEYFGFIRSGVPATNNAAEQSIRRVVIDRKVTQGTRSDWGNRWTERFWSIISTCEQQSINVMTFLKSCVESSVHGLAPPTFRSD